MPSQMFGDRRDAGRAPATVLTAHADRQDTMVLALPRGGVPAGFEVAQALHAPLDVFIARRLGVPGHEGFAMGAIASGGVRGVLKRTSCACSNEVVCATTPEPFRAGGQWYRDFSKTSDDEVHTLKRRRGAAVQHGKPADAEDQFDAEQNAPLERNAEWDEAELPETYPAGV